ncbi:MAG TPA: hypothetical protein VIM29_11405 [Bacillota bacterium]
MKTILPLLLKLIISGLAAFWLYRDSRARDFNWLMWALMPLVALFSPSIGFAVFLVVAIFISYLITRPKGKLFKCPHCNKNVYYELFSCPFCRKNAKKECLQCHEPVPWEAEQCPFCKSKAITDG